MRLRCVWIIGWSRARNDFQRSSACSLRAALLALGEVVVAPQLHDVEQVADVDRERADEVAEVAPAGARCPPPRTCGTTSASLPV